MNRAECIAQINALIPDENARSFIFNGENKRERNFLTDKVGILGYFSNILVLSFGLVFSRFLEWKEKKPDERLDDFTNSMIRIYNSLNRAYDNTILSFEFIDTFMQNLQIDCLLKTDFSMNFLKKINLDTDYFSFNEKFSKILYEIQKKRISSRYINKAYDYKALISFIKMFPYLKRVKLIYCLVEGLHVIGEQKPPLYTVMLNLCDPLHQEMYSDMLNFRYLLINDGLANYFLEKVDIQDKKYNVPIEEKWQIIHLDYTGTGLTKRLAGAITNFPEAVEASGKKFVFVSDTAVEDFFIYFDITRYKTKSDSRSYFFRDFYSFNNSYLKNFALIVSDCLNAEIRQTLLDTYHEKYIQLFELLQVDSLSHGGLFSCHYDWDALITILFLEEGIHKVLKLILESDDIYKDIVQKFYQRFSEICKYLTEKTEHMVKNPTNLMLSSDLSSRRKEITCKSNALIKLASELLSRSYLRFSPSLQPTTVNQRIESLGNVYQSARASHEKINYFLENAFQVTKMALVFYESFLEYAKVLNEIDFGVETNVIYIEKNEIDLTKKKATNKFIREVNTLKKKYSVDICRISDNDDLLRRNKESLQGLLECLMTFNKRCNDINSPENRTIRKAIGKNELIDDEDLQYIVDTYIEILNNNDDKKILDKLYRHTCAYLKYMESGTLEDDGEYNMQKAVLPLTGVYSNSVVSRDGYLSSYFILDLPGDAEKKIKVLSDDSFQFGEEYFCLPNHNRIAKISKSGEELWVSPIIINYKYFSQNYFAVFSDKCEEKDYETISGLIYQTDPHIYSALFGNIDNARKVLPLLFKVPRSMFSIENYVTVQQDGKVIAVGSLYNKAMFWDRNIVIAAMKQAGVEFPESFEAACNYFQDTYNDTTGYDKSLICDICVDEPYRHKGVGKFLLMNIIKLTKRIMRDLIITVYADNYPAINLYKALDFIEYERFLDDRGYKRPKELCLKMIRFNNA